MLWAIGILILAVDRIRRIVEGKYPDKACIFDVPLLFVSCYSME